MNTLNQNILLISNKTKHLTRTNVTNSMMKGMKKNKLSNKKKKMTIKLLITKMIKNKKRRSWELQINNQFRLSKQQIVYNKRNLKKKNSIVIINNKNNRKILREDQVFSMKNNSLLQHTKVSNCRNRDRITKRNSNKNSRIIRNSKRDNSCRDLNLSKNRSSSLSSWTRFLTNIELLHVHSKPLTDTTRDSLN